tara:strand:- start:555 stop:1817 length:1263 start_codon:yes stop_codon:yes gene_type:complete
MEKITSVTLDKSRITAVATNINVLVESTSNAIYSVEITRSSDGRNYDFVTNVFESSRTGNSRLRNKSIGSFNIAIPAASSGDTYTIGVFAEPHFNTMLDLGTDNDFYETFIVEQVGSAVLTLSTDGSSIENATVLGTSTGSTADSFSGTNRPTITMEDFLLTVPETADDFGAFITTPRSALDKNIGKWNEKALYWQSGNYTANGAGSSSTSLTLTSVDDLFVGMQVAYVNSVFQTALRAITAINTSTKTVTLDGAETWSDTHVIIFRAYGTRLINSAIGAKLQLDESKVKLGQITTSVDDEITSNVSDGGNINVNGTLGIGSGSTMRMRGLEKNEDAGATIISAVDNSANGGGITGGAITIENCRIVATSDRPVRTKTTIYVDGSSNQLFLSGKLLISKYPSANQTIYVDTSKIFTAGTA